MNEVIFGQVTTSNIYSDGTYLLNIESNSADIEYRNCTYVQQPGFNTFPKVGDTVLLIVVKSGEYAVLGIVSYNAKQYMSLGDNTSQIKINATDIQLIGTTITANGEDLTIDNIGAM